MLNIINRTQKRNFITVVQQAETCYREFLGGNRIKLEPGLSINIPFLHTLHRVDIRETGINIDDLTSFTKDNVPVRVSGVLFFKVFNSEKACFSIKNYKESISAVGSSTTRAVIGSFDYDEIIKTRNEINNTLTKTIGESIDSWGIRCSRFEISNFEPQNKHVADNLEKQMQAERARRENELNTQANIRTAEGEKLSKIHHVDGIYYESQKKAEAEKYTIEQSTEALIGKIDNIKQALPNLYDNDIMTIILEEKRLEHLQSIATNSSNSTYFVDPNSAFPSVKALINKTFNT